MAFLPGWRHIRIAQEVIHLRHTGGGKIAQPTGLHRSRFPGEHGQSVFTRMAGTIQQHMYAIRVNQAGSGFVTQADQRFPGGKVWFDADCKFIHLVVGGVGDQLNAGRIDLCQDAFQEKTDRMVMQVSGHKPYPQAFRRGAHCQAEKRTPTFLAAIRPYLEASSR